MTCMLALQNTALSRILRWLGTPDTIGTWLVSTCIWVSVLFTASLLVGTSVGYRSVGLSAGLFLGGIAFLLMTDQMWRRLEISS